MILIPVKDLSRAKQRLASLLDQSARTELAQVMLSDVLTAWQAPLDSHDASAGMHLGRIFRHYTVFSIVGRLDVVAAQCRIV